MTLPPIEPSADVRQLAHLWAQMMTALQTNGFTREEAFALLRVFMAATLGRPQ